MSAHKSVLWWLITLCLMILGTLVVGGLTRLTDSGLSMVDWRPIMGVLPPLNKDDWIKAFEAYKLFPEYLQLNQGMDLAGFKKIFIWEYLHRMLARSLSFVFLFPWLYFIITKKITHRFAGKTLIGFFLGGLQGLLGWYMVQSGLVDRPDVSHYRLAAHLCLAIFIYSYFLWLILDLTPAQETVTSLRLKTLSWTLIGLTSLQIIWGAFTGGLKAGYIYNTFPKMNNSWLPEAMFYLDPWWINLFENPGTVQFVHRSLAWVLFFSLTALALYIFKSKASSSTKKRALFILVAILVQFSLGIFNLIYQAPIHIAIVHQFGAVLLLTSLIVFTHRLKQ